MEKATKSGWRRLTRTTNSLLACAAGLAICLAMLGFRVNLTPSMPAGLYRIVSGQPDKDGLVALDVPPDWQEFAAARGYSSVPLLKRLAAVAGDRIDISSAGIRVNAVLQPDSRIRFRDSRGRPVPSCLHPGVVPSGSALVLGQSADSFDSRYFGLVPLRELQPVQAVTLITGGIPMSVKSEEQDYLRDAAREVDRTASANPGLDIPVDPDVASYMGAFPETAVSPEEL